MIWVDVVCQCFLGQAITLLTQMLEQNTWRIAETAGQLGISRKALWDKMRRLDVVRPGSEKSEEA